MDLKGWLRAERGRAVRLAERLGCTAPFVREYAESDKPFPVEHCATVESFTARVVMRWDLRPLDWWKVWPELATHPRAPRIPSPAAEA